MEKTNKENTGRSKKIKKVILTALGVTGLVGLGYLVGNKKARTKVTSKVTGLFTKKTAQNVTTNRDNGNNRPYLKERYYQKNRQTLNS